MDYFFSTDDYGIRIIIYYNVLFMYPMSLLSLGTVLNLND